MCRVCCIEKNVFHGDRIAYFPFLFVCRKEGEMSRSWGGGRNGNRRQKGIKRFNSLSLLNFVLESAGERGYLVRPFLFFTLTFPPKPVPKAMRVL